MILTLGLATAVAVVVQEAPDRAAELVSVDIDLTLGLSQFHQPFSTA